MKKNALLGALLLGLCFISVTVPQEALAAENVPTLKFTLANLPTIVATVNGQSVSAQMSQAEIQRVITHNMPAEIKNFIEINSGGAVTVSIETFTSAQTVTSMSPFGSEFWVAPEDLPSDVASLFDNNDVVVAITRMPDQLWPSWGGISSGPYAFTLVPEDPSWNPPDPWWIILHEVSHSLISRLEEVGFREMPNLDNTAYYGYEQTVEGTEKFFRDFYAGKVYDPVAKKYLGITREMWQYIPATSQAPIPRVFEIDLSDFGLANNRITLKVGEEFEAVAKIETDATAAELAGLRFSVVAPQGFSMDEDGSFYGKARSAGTTLVEVSAITDRGLSDKVGFYLTVTKDSDTDPKSSGGGGGGGCNTNFGTFILLALIALNKLKPPIKD